jgi:hypothetical protein
MSAGVPERRDDMVEPDVVWVALLGQVMRVVPLGCGFGSIYFGYRLFMAGVGQSNVEGEGRFGTLSIVLKSAAPGTFFALLGAIVMVSAIMQSSVSVESHTKTGDVRATNSASAPVISETNERVERVDAVVAPEPVMFDKDVRVQTGRGMHSK